jgi:hypothetical protein
MTEEPSLDQLWQIHSATHSLAVQAHAIIDKLKGVDESVLDTIGEHSDLHVQHEGNIDDLVGVTTTHGDTLTALDVTVTGLNSKVFALEPTVGTNTANIDLLRDDVDVLQPLVSGNVANISTLTANVGVLQTDLDALEVVVGTHTTTLASLEGDVVYLNTHVGDLETLTGTHTTEIAAVESDVATLQSAVAANTSAITAVEADVATLQPAVVDLQTDVGVLRTDVDGLTTVVGAHTTALALVESDVDYLNTHVGDLETLTDAHTTAISAVEGDIATLQPAVADNTAAIGVVETDVATLQPIVANIETILDNRRFCIERSTDVVSWMIAKTLGTRSNWQSYFYIPETGTTMEDVLILIDPTGYLQMSTDLVVINLWYSPLPPTPFAQVLSIGPIAKAAFTAATDHVGAVSGMYLYGTPLALPCGYYYFHKPAWTVGTMAAGQVAVIARCQPPS